MNLNFLIIFNLEQVEFLLMGKVLIQNIPGKKKKVYHQFRVHILQGKVILNFFMKTA